MEEISIFGKGFLYCMGLFCQHAADDFHYPLLWFNGASDHLLEMETPDVPEPLKTRIETFKDKCLQWGNGELDPETKDVMWAIRESLEILRVMDEHIGIETIRAEVL